MPAKKKYKIRTGLRSASRSQEAELLAKAKRLKAEITLGADPRAMAEAARLLGVSRVTLWKWMKHYGLDVEQSSNARAEGAQSEE